MTNRGGRIILTRGLIRLSMRVRNINLIVTYVPPNLTIHLVLIGRSNNVTTIRIQRHHSSTCDVRYRALSEEVYPFSYNYRDIPTSILARLIS